MVARRGSAEDGVVIRIIVQPLYTLLYRESRILHTEHHRQNHVQVRENTGNACHSLINVYSLTAAWDGYCMAAPNVTDVLS